MAVLSWSETRLRHPVSVFIMKWFV